MVSTSGNNQDNTNLVNNSNQIINPVLPASQNTTPVSIPTPTNPLPLQPTTVDQPVSENPEDLDTRWTRWRCMVCNYTYEGREPLKKCPRCGNDDPDKFNDVD